MAGSGGAAVVPTNADLSEALEQGALGNRSTQTDHAALIGASSNDLVGTGVTVQDVLEELDNGQSATPFSKLAADSAEVNASVTVVASGLSVTLPQAGTYEVEAIVLVTTAAAADVKFQFLAGTATITGTVGVSDIVLVNGPSGDGTAAALPLLLPTSWTTAITIATTGALADQPFVFKGHLVATVAGTVTLSFAQGTSDGSDTHIDKGSHLIARRVA